MRAVVMVRTPAASVTQKARCSPARADRQRRLARESTSRRVLDPDDVVLADLHPHAARVQREGHAGRVDDVRRPGRRRRRAGRRRPSRRFLSTPPGRCHLFPPRPPLPTAPAVPPAPLPARPPLPVLPPVPATPAAPLVPPPPVPPDRASTTRGGPPAARPRGAGRAGGAARARAACHPRRAARASAAVRSTCACRAPVTPCGLATRGKQRRDQKRRKAARSPCYHAPYCGHGAVL